MRTSYAAPTVKTLLRRDWNHRSPSGGGLTARRWGRLFVVLDVDRYGPPFPERVAAVMAPMADDLALLAFHSRDWPTVISHFGTCGTLYAPNAIAGVLLEVLLAADADDPGPAATLAVLIEARVGHLRTMHGSVRAKRDVARTIVALLEHYMGCELVPAAL